MTSKLKFKLTQECSQRWYRLHSWKACGFKGRILYEYRKSGKTVGAAFGPIMFFWRYGS